MSVSKACSTPDWHSPLVRSSVTTESQKQESEICEENSFGSTQRFDLHSLSYALLFEIYNTNFDKPKQEENAQQFFAIREQVFAIESLLTRCDDSAAIAVIRDQVSIWLLSSNYEIKMAELGLLLFYLDRDGAIHKINSFIDYRAGEIKKEVLGYIQAHSAAQANKDIPSGKTHYLMRAFAHMLFVRDPLTKGQSYNRGALFAVKQLLLQPSAEISQFLQPEHREHILIVAEQLLNHASMDNFFSKKLIPHPDLQDAIRLDLKLKPGEPVSSIHAYYACIMTLFSDIRQGESPNCYAVGALIYATENHTYKVLSHLVKWLIEGHFSVDGTTFPIRPLMEKRLVTRYDLDRALESSKALTLVPLGNLTDLLALDAKENRSGEQSVGHFLSELLKANNAVNLQNDAEKYYCTYRSPALLHLLLAVLETCWINKKGSTFEKEMLIASCLKGVDETLKQLPPSSPLFHAYLKIRLENKLWFENYRENKTVIDQTTNSLVAGAHKITGFQGDLLALSQLFKKAKRVFCLISGNYLPLVSYNDLQNVLIAAIKEVELVLKHEGHHQEAAAAQHYINAVNHWNFRVAVSNFASSQIEKKGISGKDLNQCNLLIFREIGGVMEVALEATFGINVMSQNLVACTTPYRFLEKLMGKLKDFDEDLFKSSRRVMINTRKHAWTLSPKCWKMLLENQNDFHAFIQNNVFTPAKKKLGSWVSPDLIERVIKSYAQNEQTVKEMSNFFNMNRKISHNAFIEKLFEGLRRQEFVIRMKFVIEEEFSKVKLNKKELESVLKQLSLQINEVLLESLFLKIDSIPKKPSQLAIDLRSLLLEERVAILEPIDIEQALCKVLQLPLPIEVGDLNWVSSYREDPEHMHLVIDFSWVSKVPVYLKRVRGLPGHEMEDEKNYDCVKIQHPKTSVHKPSW